VAGQASDGGAFKPGASLETLASQALNPITYALICVFGSSESGA